MIYFVQCNNYIKIGNSTNPRKRLSDMQTASPYKLKLLKTIPGDYAEEERLHKKFRGIRVNGEWFCAEKRLLNYIAKV